jgi:hypothetical protein
MHVVRPGCLHACRCIGHRRPRAVNWRMRLDQVERTLKCEELLIRDATPRSAL